MKEGRDVIVVIQGILVWYKSLQDWLFDFTLIFELTDNFYDAGQYLIMKVSTKCSKRKYWPEELNPLMVHIC